MKTILTWKRAGNFAIVAALTLFAPGTLSPHCDTMNGPVVTAAVKALETGDVNLVLIWVQKQDEAEIREAFQNTMAIRRLSEDARKLADHYFFETLVRVHRAGEGVAYTGLKPAETKVDPGIAAADEAVESGSAEHLVQHLSEALHHNLAAYFKEMTEKKHFAADDVEAGRAYVRAYVEFIHYVERIHQAIAQPVEGHFHEAGEGAMGHEGH